MSFLSLLFISSCTSGYLLRPRVSRELFVNLVGVPFFLNPYGVDVQCHPISFSDFALLGLLGSDACQFLLCCLFAGVFCLLCFSHELIFQSADVVIGFVDFFVGLSPDRPCWQPFQSHFPVY
jgi:hypothetical protein